MPQRWYCYDRSGTVSGPFYETRAEAADACADGETPRPVNASVVDADSDTDGAGDGLDELTHEELKARAEAAGIADETDLRSKSQIIAALREHDG
jgi:hypothetical protein